MATFMCYITGKLARTIVWILMFILLLLRVTPLVISNLFRLLELIKGRKFMYVFLNSIIISILISSSSFIPYITNIFLKLRENSKLRFTTQKLVTSSYPDNDDDNTWWFFTYMDHELPMEFTSTSTVIKEDETKITSSYQVLEEKEERKVEEEEERDDLDATWKAIMESQGKGSRPQLRKSDTWSCGDGGGKEREKEKGEMGGLSKHRVKGKLKKWQSFREMIEGRGNVGGDSSGGGGGEKPRRRSMEVALTFHDEFKKRADAFIARFTHDIRLQRLESDQRFLEMINRGL